MGITLTPLDGPFGRIVHGVDLTRPLSDADFAAVRAALFEHQALVFRGQTFSPADQVRFTERFGPMRKSNMQAYVLGEQPEVFVVSNIMEGDRHIGVYDAGLFWHSDGSFMDPPHGVLALHALEVPVDETGHARGATVIASTTRAWDALPEATRRRLAGVRAVNTLLLRHKKTVDTGIKTDVITAAAPADMTCAQPVGRPHPVTGRQCLYVNEGYTARLEGGGLSEDEARALLDELLAHVTRPEFLYTHVWQPGDLLVWDNLATQHRATFDYQLPQRRLMHRTAALVL